MAKVTPRLIALEIDGTDVSDDISRGVIGSAPSDSDFMTFRQSRSGGGREYTLAMTIAQDHAAGSLFEKIWSKDVTPGVSDKFVGVYAPYGNEVASVAQPHYEFSGTIAEPDGDFLGAEADESVTAVATIEVEWKLDGRPEKIITA